jgi:large subunit ribosomal protein L10
MRLEEKKKISEDLHDRFSKSAIVVVTDYQGLNVTTMNDLRRQLRKEKIEFQVVKNKLLIRASENTDVALIRDYFKGPSAVALSYEDPVAPAKILTQFAASNDKLAIRAGVMNGRFLDANAIKALAKLPSKEILLSQLLMVLHMVPTAFVRTIAEIPRRMLNVLSALKNQKEAA